MSAPLRWQSGAGHSGHQVNRFAFVALGMHAAPAPMDLGVSHVNGRLLVEFASMWVLQMGTPMRVDQKRHPVAKFDDGRWW